MMKKIFTLSIILIAFATTTKAQYVNIPDSNFRSFLIAKYPTCFNSAKQMDTTCGAITNEDTLDCSYKSIVSLDGIEYFKSLVFINCSYNLLDSLHSLPNSLKSLNCFSNQLVSLHSLPSSLLFLNCSANLIANLPTLPISLTYLDCAYNELSSLPNLPNSLATLNCGQNFLVALPSLPNSLTTLSCVLNNITSLPSLPNSLISLDGSNNKLTILPQLPNSLIYLGCQNNQLTFLPSLPNFLSELECRNNQISSLPILPNSLTRLYCGFNQLTNLPILPNSLATLYCGNNQIANLQSLPNLLKELNCEHNPISCLPKLPYNLEFLFFDSTLIICTPNSINSAAIIFPSLSLCNPTNNPNGCISFPVMQGNIYADINANNKWDNTEFGKRKVKISLSNGSSTFTHNNGFYEISADTIGTNTITINQPNLYNAQPASFVHNFSKYDTLVTDTFALQPHTIKDSLSINTTPINWAARPGFSYPYLISSENVGTTITNPTIHFIWDSSKLVLDSTNNVAAINVGNDISWSINSFVPGQIDNVVAYFRVKPTTTIGDSIKYTATINGGTASAIDSGKVIVRGSYDPNEKHATPMLTPTQCALGNDINYIIYFQNTGTDTAFTVVIADTLSNNVMDSTLQIVASSHDCKTTQNGKHIFFEFKNILLPDSNVNEKKSHGFVSFKVKPKTTLVNGNTVANKAFIYFDYNAPIITNTAITQINTSGQVLPVKITSYNVQVKGNIPLLGGARGGLVLNAWTTATETNALLFNIQRSTDGRSFKTFGKVLAKGSNNYYEFTDELRNLELGIRNLYYRLQIIDKDGSISYSEVRNLELGNRNERIQIYPNPAKDVVSIRCAGAQQLLMIDYLGKTIKQFNNVTQPQIINTKQFTKGIYTIQVITNKGEVLSEKLIVE